MEYKIINLKSDKLGKDVELEAYETEDGAVIVSTNSLKKLFEKMKSENGVTTSVLSDVRVNDRGCVLYASVELTIRDNQGYSSVFIGEATNGSLTNSIAKTFPKTTAFNRAMSSAIISYLQLPGKIYSDFQMANAEERDANMEKSLAASDTKSVLQEKTITMQRNADSESKNACELVKTLKNDEKPVEAVKSEETIKTTPEVEVSDIEIPADVPAEELDKDMPVSNKAAAVESVKPTAPSDVSAPVNKRPDDNMPSAQETSLSNDNITEDTLIGMGNFANISIGELFKMQEEGDAFASKLIDACKKGVISENDAHKKAIILYIAKKAS